MRLNGKGKRKGTGRDRDRNGNEVRNSWEIRTGKGGNGTGGEGGEAEMTWLEVRKEKIKMRKSCMRRANDREE